MVAITIAISMVRLSRVAGALLTDTVRNIFVSMNYPLHLIGVRQNSVTSWSITNGTYTGFSRNDDQIDWPFFC